jgi:uncharacterized phosphosugar-binding protein
MNLVYRGGGIVVVVAIAMCAAMLQDSGNEPMRNDRHHDVQPHGDPALSV